MKRIFGLVYKDIVQTKSTLILSIILYLSMMVLEVISFIMTTNEVIADPNITTLDFSMNSLFTISSAFIFGLILPSQCLSQSFAIDEKCNFNRFILSSGATRKSIIDGKFMFALVITIFPTIFAIVLCSVLGIYATNVYITPRLIGGLFTYTLLGTIAVSGFAILSSTFMSSISNQVVWNLLSLILSFAVYGGLFLGAYMISNDTANAIYYGGSVLFLILIVLFYFGSRSVYNHKDL